VGFAVKRRLGLLDLPLLALLCWVAVTRTPVGALGWYAVERIRGHGPELPTLTAFFSTGAVAVPDPTSIALPPAGPVVATGLPEPYRTAAGTVLSQGKPSLADVDAAFAISGSVEAALESAAIGADQRARAIARSRETGDADPESYAVHRRWLAGSVQREGDRVVGGTMALATTLDLAWPIASSYRVSSPFGMRMHPVLGEERFHNGVDLAVPVGTEVRAAQRGRVAVVGQDAVSGNYAVLDHGYGIRTSYCHLSAVNAARGASLDRAEVFAASGTTGRSTGPHLHFTLKIGGRAVDPQRFSRPAPLPLRRRRRRRHPRASPSPLPCRSCRSYRPFPTSRRRRRTCRAGCSRST
jgi:murein DD-endopeptidase MepM/ murein hydrolase activator NlpD